MDLGVWVDYMEVVGGSLVEGTRAASGVTMEVP